jgi:hypothetical protein
MSGQFMIVCLGADRFLQSSTLCVVRSIKERSAASLMALFSKVLDRCIPEALSSMMRVQNVSQTPATRDTGCYHA